ncbi:VOC family protein [Glutamicibacter sp. JL.03c]|uniref:VOC family protein n=1 Tax=Glutamicibacter sp. JL.03c TaxID=2984842 RepID=UPI0021F7C80D|nr:VOC family protein [Glutamicibacter sp. JL.03c]UYQ77784.1 VOC family protein [Glutamicibacter sp. JL.03c]
MLGPTVYILFPGTARQALDFYQEIFGGELALYTLEEFNRTDGDPQAIAHGELTGQVCLGGADASAMDRPLRAEGMMLSLLGTAQPEVLHQWFDKLSAGGEVIDPLTEKPWGAVDGQVRDRHGVHWLIGYEPENRESQAPS